jgi:predicted secreted protein
MKRLSEQDDGREIEIRVGESMELALPETSGTGYKWNFGARAEPILKLEEDAYSQTAAGPGGNRMRRLRFTAVAPGEATLELSYGRSWERRAPARSFKLKLRAVAAR